MDVNVWMEKARQMIKEMRTGSMFTLRKLFEGTDWTKLSAGERRKFGKVFKKEVDQNHVEGVPASDYKTSSITMPKTRKK